MDASRQLKRLRRNNAGASSDNYEDEIEQVEIMGNNSEHDSEEEAPGSEIPEAAVKHTVQSKTKCWLFLESLRKV